ncbi:MAG: DUF2059 domain-containing protein [Gammaproteobacteria bacterium]|jgi:hypothetical protein
MKSRSVPALLLLLAAAAWPLAGVPDEASHRQAVERLFELTDMQQKIAESVDNVMLMQLSQNPALREHQDVVHAFLEKTIGWEGLEDDLTQMYLETFTEEEINEINAFYASPTGRKLIRQLPELVERRNRLAMQRLQKNIGELQQMIQQQSGQKPQ